MFILTIYFYICEKNREVNMAIYLKVSLKSLSLSCNWKREKTILETMRLRNKFAPTNVVNVILNDSVIFFVKILAFGLF